VVRRGWGPVVCGGVFVRGTYFISVPIFGCDT
jgi:hypothetical protein